MVTVFAGAGFSAEMEAQSVHALLESGGIASLLVRDNVTALPVGRVEVRVIASLAEQARQLIDEAEKSGPAAAEEAEAETEI